ncbi:MAG TPA: AraC family transcriptional regulator [Vicinamibacterales bacterium]|nr:AraC family transcriptional regulator [Vicinamibacterales bacterium]
MEQSILRGVLVDLCLQWGDAAHRACHSNDRSTAACAFKPGVVAAEAWSDRGKAEKTVLTHWAARFMRGLERRHHVCYARSVQEYLDASFARPHVLQQLAGQWHTSPRRLQREFKALTGMRIQDYLSRRRVEAACALLTGTDHKVETVAHSVGWSSRKNLNRALARHRGQTPGAIRASAIRRPI